jgi:dihydrolipoamide dehydrogenase
MKNYDVIILGGGPGGYAAAVEAIRFDLETALIETELIGGTCVNWGCIPTKAMLRYAKNLKDNPVEYHTANTSSLAIAGGRREKIEALLIEKGVNIYHGQARLATKNEVDINSGDKRIFGKNIIIATGSMPLRLPIAAYDDHDIFTTREALQIKETPSSMVIIGSGATGMEFATIWNSFGSKVTVLEMKPTIMGTEDKEISEAAIMFFQDSGIKIYTDAVVESVIKTNVGAETTFSINDRCEKVVSEKVLIAAGITPNSNGLGLEELNVERNSRGYILINKQMQTNIPNIYAVGDITGKLALALTASEQAKIAVRSMVGEKTSEIVYENIPRCIYSEIEVASVGLTERQAHEHGFEPLVIRSPTLLKGGNQDYEFTNLIMDAKNQTLLGAVLIGIEAAEKVAAPARLIELGVTVPQAIKSMNNMEARKA